MKKIRHGNITVTLDGGMQRGIREVIDRLAPTVSRRLEAEAAGLAAGARTDWPVGRERGRPHSRDLIEHGLRISGKRLEGFVTVDVPYATQIRVAGKLVVSELLRKPLKLAAAAVVRDCADDIRKLIRKR